MRLLFFPGLLVSCALFGGCAAPSDRQPVSSTEQAVSPSSSPQEASPDEMPLPGGWYCTNRVERRLFALGAPTPFVVMRFGDDKELVLTSTHDDVARSLASVALPLEAGWSACARGEREPGTWAYGRILHVDSFYAEPPAQPAGPRALP